MEIREAIRRTSDALYAGWNAHDADAVAACYAPDAEVIDATSGIITHGRASIRAVAEGRLAGFAEYELTRETLLIDGMQGAESWCMRGTHTGDYDGLAPTGRHVAVKGSTLSTYDAAGFIVRDTHYVNVLGLLQQLGIE